MDKKLMIKMNEEKLREFWEIIKPVKKNDYVEIRCAGNKFEHKSIYYNKLRMFQEQYPEIIVKKGVQFFIKNFEELLKIVKFDDEAFSKNMKLCYGLCLRNAKTAELLDGSYKCVKQGRFVFLDIESVSHDDITGANQAILDEYVKLVTNYLKKFGLVNPIIIHSGAGRHTLYKISYFKITEARKRGYKHFIKQLQERFKDDRFIIDNVYDFTRIFGLPQTYNPSRNRIIEVINLPENIKNTFVVPSKRAPKFKKVDIDTALPALADSLEWKLMIHPDLPLGEIHTTLLFALKLFMKQKNILDYQDLQNKMNSVRGSNHLLNPLIGTEGKDYSPGIVINYCKKNYDWLQTQPDLLETYKKYVQK